VPADLDLWRRSFFRQLLLGNAAVDENNPRRLQSFFNRGQVSNLHPVASCRSGSAICSTAPGTAHLIPALRVAVHEYIQAA
jgi:hypothetical protein